MSLKVGSHISPQKFKFIKKTSCCVTWMRQQNARQVLRGGRTWRPFSFGVYSEIIGRVGRTGRLLFWGLTAEGCRLERVGKKGGDDWDGMWSQAELPFCSGVSLQVSWSLSASDLGLKIFVVKGPSFLHRAQSAEILGPQFCTVNKKMTILQSQRKTPLMHV